jgi:hypothetical protein
MVRMNVSSTAIYRNTAIMIQSALITPLSSGFKKVIATAANEMKIHTATAVHDAAFNFFIRSICSPCSNLIYRMGGSLFAKKHKAASVKSLVTPQAPLLN